MQVLDRPRPSIAVNSAVLPGQRITTPSSITGCKECNIRAAHRQVFEQPFVSSCSGRRSRTRSGRFWRGRSRTPGPTNGYSGHIVNFRVSLRCWCSSSRRPKDENDLQGANRASGKTECLDEVPGCRRRSHRILCSRRRLVCHFAARRIPSAIDGSQAFGYRFSARNDPYSTGPVGH
jgi:hypothetical protein